MKHDQINYFVVGLFVLLSGLALLAVVYRLTGTGRAVDNYHVYYQNVAGLKFGTPVYYEGFQIGQVDEIRPEKSQGKTRYQVQTSVVESWKIPVDSVALIISSGLLSAKSLDIREGNSSEYLKPGDEIRGEPALNIMTAINDAAEDFHLLSAGVKPLIDSLQAGVSGVLLEMSALISHVDNLLSRELKQVLDKAAARVDSPQVFAELTTLLGRLNQTADSLNLLLSTANRQHVSEILINLDGLSRDLQQNRQQITALLGNMDTVVTEVGGLASDNRQDLQEAVIRLRESMEVIASHVDAVSHHLHDSSRNMNEFTRQIRENPSLLLRGSAQPEAGVSQ